MQEQGSSLKTRKLTCIITGRSLIAAADYYNKKLEKAGSVEELHRTYICKEAKDLLVKGFTIDKIRQQLGVEGIVEDKVPDDVIRSITTNEFGLKRNTMFAEISAFTRQETDPAVKDFINKIYAE